MITGIIFNDSGGRSLLALFDAVFVRLLLFLCERVGWEALPISKARDFDFFTRMFDFYYHRTLLKF